MKDISACLSNKSDEWSTPKDLYSIFEKHGCFDPCKLGQKEDGLLMEWGNINYVNPPFSKLFEFVDKAIHEWACKGHKTILLMPVRTDTQYFKRLYETQTDFLFICGRLKFGSSNRTASFPTLLCFIGFECITQKMNYVDRQYLNELVDYFLFVEKRRNKDEKRR